MYWINLDEADGSEIPFPSEIMHTSAEGWYNDSKNTKAKIIRFCRDRNIDLSDPTSENDLISCWADIAMAVYAWQEADPKMLPLIDLVSRHVRYL